MSEWCKHQEFLSNALHQGIKTNFKCPWCTQLDEPSPPERKKLWEIIKYFMPEADNVFIVDNHYRSQADAALKAVIEVYEKWYATYSNGEQFRDYLKKELL